MKGQAFEKFIRRLSSFMVITPEEVQMLRDLVPIHTYPKGDFLIRAGDISKSFFFNASGFVRLFYLLNGEEKTTYFYDEGTFISAYSSFLKQEPCSFFLQAAEETQVATISIEASESILAYSTKFEKLARIAMEEEMVSLQEIIASLITLSPEKRYLELLNRNPTIFQKVPQTQIASFLGVKPESLSRIKKRSMERS